MGLFDRKNKAINQLSNNPLQTLASGLKRMWAMAPKRDKMELVDLAHKSPRLDPVFIIARAVAGTEWNTYNRIDIKKNGKTAAPVFNEDIMSLLDYPIRRYPEIDWYALCYSTVAVVKAVGEYGWLKVRDERNKVIELNPIPPGWIMRTPTVGDPFYTIYPFGATAGVAIRVSPDDFIYFKRPDLNDPYGRGRGDSEQLEDEFEIDEYASKAQKNLLYNDSTPPYIITAPGMPQDQAEAFKKSWMQKLGGYLHRREPGVLGFDAKVQTLGMSPLEMDMMESRKFIRDEIYMHYQIPPEIYGNIQNSNRSTITSAEYLFHKNALNTEYRFFERQITRQLIAVDFDKNLCFKFDDVVPDDEDFKLSVLNAGLTGGVVQVDEWRKAFDLPELPNGKGKVFLRTFAQYEVPADGKEPELPPDKPSGQTEDKPTDDELLSPEDLGLDAESAKSFKIVDYSTEKVSIVHKYNENHDESGRFASDDGGGNGDSSDAGQDTNDDKTDAQIAAEKLTSICDAGEKYFTDRLAEAIADDNNTANMTNEQRQRYREKLDHNAFDIAKRNSIYKVDQEVNNGGAPKSKYKAIRKQLTDGLASIGAFNANYSEECRLLVTFFKDTKGIIKANKEIGKYELKKIDDDARLTAIWKAFDSRATAKEGEFIQAVKKYAEDQKKRVVSAINNSKLEDTIKSGGAYNAEIESILRTVFDDKANKALKSALAPAWLHSLESGRDHTYDMIYGNFGKAVKAPTIRPSMTVVNRLFQEYVESVGLLKAEGINDTTNEKLRKKLQDAISEGISNGDTINTIKNSILDICDGVYDEMSTSRAITVARTESAASLNAGSLMTASSEGATKKVWLSVRDGRTRGNDPHDEFDHLIADGEEVGINEDFTNTGEPMAYPLDSKGSAGNCVNCRCSMTYSFD